MTVTIGERIKSLRLLADMSQEELGNRVGVQRAAINKYEKGIVTNIPISTIEKMADLFDVSPTYIVGWGDSGNPLAIEVKVLQGVKQFYGGDCVDLIEEYISLNQQGKKRVHQYVQDISRVYREEI
jgi:transcriptional regulator with XRE-family HTH domain